MPKHTLCSWRPASRRDGQRVCRPNPWPGDPRAFSSGGPAAVCVERGNDAADEARRVGGAATAGGVDSGGYAARSGDVGHGFDEDAVFSAEALPNAPREMFCDEYFAPVARTDSSCLQIQEVEQESFGGTEDYRDYRGSVESGGFDPAAVTASDGHAGDARGEGAAGGPERSERPGKTLQRLRREQENDSAGVSGRNEDEFREMAAATTSPSWAGTDGFGRKGDGSGSRGGL